jgi:hypothetical protein
LSDEIKKTEKSIIVLRNKSKSGNVKIPPTFGRACCFPEEKAVDRSKH